MAIEALLGGLVLLMLLVATFMALEGILGSVGAAEIIRCADCDHLILRSKNGACPYCRHPQLAHVLHAPALARHRHRPS